MHTDHSEGNLQCFFWRMQKLYFASLHVVQSFDNADQHLLHTHMTSVVVSMKFALTPQFARNKGNFPL